MLSGKALTDSPPTVVTTPTVAIAVVTRRRPSSSRWVESVWDVEGVLVGDQVPSAPGPEPMHAEADESLLLWGGLRLGLYPDQGETYYFNLLSPEPKLFVICTTDPVHQIRPQGVTLSYEEAMGHVEGQEDVFSVPMPPELVRRVERFVLEHYVPEKKRKRKRVEWSGSGTARD